MILSPSLTNIYTRVHAYFKPESTIGLQDFIILQLIRMGKVNKERLEDITELFRGLDSRNIGRIDRSNLIDKELFELPAGYPVKSDNELKAITKPTVISSGSKNTKGKLSEGNVLSGSRNEKNALLNKRIANLSDSVRIVESPYGTNTRKTASASSCCKGMHNDL